MKKLLEVIEELESKMNDISCECAFTYYDCNSYVCDAIAEYADSNVDIYYSDLWKWAADNYEYIELAIDEFGAPEKFDMIAAIRQGQYYQYERMLYDDLENIIKLSAVYYMTKILELEELEESTLESIMFEIDGLDNNDTFEDIRDAVKEVLNLEEDEEDEEE